MRNYASSMLEFPSVALSNSFAEFIATLQSYNLGLTWHSASLSYPICHRCAVCGTRITTNYPLRMQAYNGKAKNLLYVG